MRKNAILFVFLLAGCTTVTMWIPLQTTPRAAVPADRVQYLQAPPTHPYEEIGIITPPAGEYETEAEAVQAMRREAAKYGADAIFIESQTETGGWGFSVGPFGGGGGTIDDVTYRAKAIIWK